MTRRHLVLRLWRLRGSSGPWDENGLRCDQFAEIFAPYEEFHQVRKLSKSGKRSLYSRYLKYTQSSLSRDTRQYRHTVVFRPPRQNRVRNFLLRELFPLAASSCYGHFLLPEGSRLRAPRLYVVFKTISMIFLN